ncbi:MAG: SDR family oxidoreductase, partial [Salinisphaera sp.]|nr:SDR family oxidoreductase [Salinisphaera sp.]
GEVVYSGCKGGTIAFSKALARELARKNVLLNCICPGPTNTPIMDSFAGAGEQGEKLRAALVRAVPLGRIGEPEDYAGAAAFLASDDAGFITGQTLSVSGGLTMHGGGHTHGYCAWHLARRRCSQCSCIGTYAALAARRRRARCLRSLRHAHAFTGYERKLLRGAIVIGHRVPGP